MISIIIISDSCFNKKKKKQLSTKIYEKLPLALSQEKNWKDKTS